MSYEEMEHDTVVSPSGHHGCGCNLNCVCQVVRAIKDIQDQAVEDECDTCTSSCFVEPLGDLGVRGRKFADTRVITLTNKKGDLLKGFFNPLDGKCHSVHFRVEELFDGCCATLRVLVPMGSDKKPVQILNPDGSLNLSTLCHVKYWTASNNCITVDLHCFCAVQCIADCDLGICE